MSKTIIINFNHKATIDNAVTIKKKLVTATEQGDIFKIDVSQIENADLSFLQLLTAFCRDMTRHGKHICVIGISDYLNKLIENAGFFQFKECILSDEKKCVFNHYNQEGKQNE